MSLIQDMKKHKNLTGTGTGYPEVYSGTSGKD